MNQPMVTEPDTRSVPTSRTIVGAVVFVVATALAGYLVWFVSVMGSDVCLAAATPVTWSCTTAGQMTIAWIVPGGSLIAWALLLTARSHRKQAMRRPGPALIMATVMILGSWFLSISLAMSSHS